MVSRQQRPLPLDALVTPRHKGSNTTDMVSGKKFLLSSVLVISLSALLSMHVNMAICD